MTATALRVEEQAAPYLVAPLLTDHLDSFASSPEGFKRLRELVLNLAVRGRLSSKSMGGELPTEWGCGQFGDCAEVVRGITFPASEKSKTPEPGRVACLRTANIQGEVEWDDLLYVRKSFLSRSDQLVRQGDLVMSMANSKELVGKVAQVTDVPFPCAIGGFLAIIRGTKLSNDYLLILLRSPGVRASLIDSSTQTTNIANISLSRLRPLPVAVPPLAEQSRIVAKVEELMALITALEAKVGAGETARGKLLHTLLAALADSPDADATAEAWTQLAPHFDLLLQTPADVDRLQQTLLQLAVKGRLVPQDPSDEPAAELLKRIRAEKERLTQDEGLRTEASEEAANRPCWLPQSWHFVRLGNLAKFIDYRGRTPKKVASGIPLITAKNVRFGHVDREPREFITSEEYEDWMTRGFPKMGDVLFTTEAPLGNVALVDIKERFALAQRVICFQPHERRIGDFLRLALMSDLLQKAIENEATGMTATGIKAARLKEIPVPLPPLPEQSRIVAAVASLTALCDRLRERLAARRTLSAKLAAALTESALA